MPVSESLGNDCGLEVSGLLNTEYPVKRKGRIRARRPEEGGELGRRRQGGLTEDRRERKRPIF